MTDSTSTSNTAIVSTSVNTKCKRKTRGATMYTKVNKAHGIGVCYPLRVDKETSRAYGEHVEDLMGYVVLQGRNKVSILLDSWSIVP